MTKEKKGKIETKNLKPRIKNYEIDKENNKITMILENMSPNSLLNICGVKAEDVSIKRYGILEI